MVTAMRMSSGVRVAAMPEMVVLGRETSEDASDEKGLYSEARFKWLRLSKREKDYYEAKAAELPMALRRAEHEQSRNSQR